MSYKPNLKLSVPSKFVLIGASTGGPGQIEKIITSLPKLNQTSIIIAQHMAEGFIPSFAKRLQSYSHNHVDIAKNGEEVTVGHIYLCSGYTHVNRNKTELFFTQESSPKNSYNPNINQLFNSFISLTQDIDILSIILTGIGDDGVEACKQLSLNGAKCLTESKESAIVDGMPYRAREVVPNIKISDINGIVQKVKEFCV